jgi:ribosomal protein S18 acetylase RimI-like enzyme
VAHIRKAAPRDSPAIAALHTREIPWGLLSGLGEDFVATFYRALLASPQGFACVAEGEDHIVGFASGVVNWRGFYREFLRRHLLLAGRVLLARLSGGRWRRLLETTRYAASGALPPAELVSIAVAPAGRGRGIGGALVRAVLAEFAARGVAAVRVTAGDENAPAGRLYERAGFRLHSYMEIHPGERSAVYVIALPAEAAQPVPS